MTAVVNINTGFCPTTDVASGFSIRDTIDVTPSCNAGCSGGVRRSVVVTGAGASYLETRIHNSNASASGVVVSVSETTLFNTAWSTFGGFQTYYSVVNTTNSTIHATLTLNSTSGSIVGGPIQSYDCGRKYGQYEHQCAWGGD